jgi:ATP-dependent RNA helicase DeaD
MKSFDELELSAPVVKAIKELGFETPSAIQEQALPILLGVATDFIGQAATGTGKTAAFAIPLLEKIDPKVRSVQGIILCPTRELAKQVASQIDLLGKFLKVRALPVYGGAAYGDQIRGLRDGCQIVVGTPGRVIDHIQRGTLDLSKVHTVILDEADEMISMGFKEDLETILESSPKETSNIWLFSATLSKEVRRVADTYLRNAKQVSVNNKVMLSDSVEQVYFLAQESDKPEILCKLIEAAEDIYGIIFCQTKSLVTDLTKFLSERGYKVDSLHGDKSQNERESTMQAFRDRRLKILVCTDVASRGLDVKDVTHVINYSIPRELDVYVHRIGRTARGGSTGIAMSLVSPRQRGIIARIEQMTKSRLKAGVIPTRKDLAAKKVTKLLVKFQEQTLYSRAVEHLGKEWIETLSEMPVEEVVGRFMTMLSPELFGNQERQKLMSSAMMNSRGDSGDGDRGGGGRRRRDRDRSGGGDSRDRRSGGGRPSSGGSGGGVRRKSRPRY